MRLTLLLSLVFTAPGLSGQSFEVASVQPSLTANASPVVREDGAQLYYTDVPLIVLLMRAYHIKFRQIVGPQWLTTERYDVVAKLPDGANKDEVPKMLQALLADRFRLAAHLDSRMVPGYVLTMGKGAPRMKSAESGEGARRMKGPMGVEIKGNTSMSKLADALSDALDCPVRDETGLNGFFAVDLNWAPEENPGVTGPSIVNAVQADLGLRMEARKYPSDFLVIDRADKMPTRN